MSKFQIYLVERKKYLKEKVKSYTCKESDGVENEMTRLQYDMAEVVPSWHDFNMTGQKSCQVGTTLV